MRLLLISHAAGPYGAERVLLALARGLAGRGHDVVVEIPQPGPAREAARRDERIRCVMSERHPLPRNAREAVGYFATAVPAIRSARRTIRDVEPDLVWINSLYNPWAAIAAAASGRSVVWHLHEYRLREPLGLATAALVGAAATRIAAVSRFVAGGWARYPWLRRRTSLLPNPLLDGAGLPEPDPESGEPASVPGQGRLGDRSPGAREQRAAADESRPLEEPARPFTVGYVGQLEPRKRVPDLVRAVAPVHNVNAILVGDGKARTAVEAAVREAGIEDRVELTGFRADVRAQLARFDCMAIPSLREPFGLVALEAMAAGVPVVASRSGALPEVLGTAALYHEPGDVESLAGRIRTLKEDPKLRRELAGRGLLRVKRFGEEAWLDRAEEIARLAIGDVRGGS